MLRSTAGTNGRRTEGVLSDPRTVRGWGNVPEWLPPPAALPLVAADGDDSESVGFDRGPREGSVAVELAARP